MPYLAAVGFIFHIKQVLEVCHRVAGFTLAEGDEVRRAMTKLRSPGALNGVRKEFVQRAAGRGVPPAEAARIFGWIEAFASYGFSAAHAASFAEISYASAYMKAHYPAEFFCGLLNSQPMGFYSPRVLLNEARRGGIEILPPDINLSVIGFIVERHGAALRVGMKYAKHVTKNALCSILGAREERPFSSPADLHQRTSIGADGLASMIRGGFLDEFSDSGGRTSLLEEARRLPPRRRKQEKSVLPLDHPASRWASRESLNESSESYLPPTLDQEERMEWEALGLNVRRHPLVPYRESLARMDVAPSSEVPEFPHGRRVRVAGLLESLQRPPTRSGRRVYFLMLEDEHGLLQCTIFEGVYERLGHLLHQKASFLLEGRVEQDPRRGFSFVVEEISDLTEKLPRLPSGPEAGYAFHDDRKSHTAYPLQVQER